MNKRLISVLVFALAVSAGAAFVLYQLISTRVKAGTAEKPKTTTVFVANRDLEAGALVQEKDIKAVEYLSVPNGAIIRKEDIVGRGVTNPIHQDGAFFESGLAAKGGGAGFAVTIPVGMRACAVRVNEVMGVAGFAVAGMHVDVLVSGSAGNSVGGDTMTRTLLQDVLVLSAGQNYQKDGEGKPFYFQVVNLLVTPAQAEMLYLATDQKIQLVLRNPADHSLAETRGVHQAELFVDGAGRPLKPAAAPAAPRPQISSAWVGPIPQRTEIPRAEKKPTEAPALEAKKVTVEVYSGQKRSEATFEQTASGVNP
jgi:pilus assembly protein CpaB